jgi:hypothetical protein
MHSLLLYRVQLYATRYNVPSGCLQIITSTVNPTHVTCQIVKGHRYNRRNLKGFYFPFIGSCKVDNPVQARYLPSRYVYSRI